MALDLEAITVTFSGGTTSTVGKLGVKALVGIVLPPQWSGVAALTFNASAVNDGVNFYPLVDGTGTVISYTSGASKFYSVANLSQFASVNMIQLVSSASQTCNVTLLVRSVAF